MHPLQITLIAANAVGFSLLLWKGRLDDRLAVLVMTLTQIGSFALTEVTWNGIRAGLLSMDLLCFLFLWGLAERGGRWWLVLAAGFQLIGLLGQFAPFLAQERLAWALVTLLWGVWTLVSITVFFGVWEVMADRRFAREGRDGARMDHGGGARAAASME